MRLCVAVGGPRQERRRDPLPRVRAVGGTERRPQTVLTSREGNMGIWRRVGQPEFSGQPLVGSDCALPRVCV